MLKFTFTLFLSILINFFYCNAQVLWVKNAGGIKQQVGNAYTMDALGNSYIAGSFKDTAVIGNDTLIATGGQIDYDAFLAKADPDGNFLWARQIGGRYSNENLNAISLDEQGNINVAGFTNSNADSIIVYSKTGNIKLAAKKFNVNIFWLKFDAAGDYLQGFVPLSYTLNFPSLIFDRNQNLIVSGRFADSVRIGDKKALLKSGIYFAKLENTGNVLWLSTAYATKEPFAKSGLTSVTSMDVDEAGNIYFGGHMKDTLTGGTFNISSLLNKNVIAGKISNGGVFRWIKHAPSSNPGKGNRIKYHPKGFCYLTGFAGDATTFGTESVNGIATFFISKMDTSGNFLWVRTNPEIGNNSSGSAIAFNGGDDSIYVAANYKNANFSEFGFPGNLGAAGSFISRYNASGSRGWTNITGGLTYIQGMELDKAGNPYITGTLFYSADFDDTVTITAKGHDFFIAKFDGTKTTTITTIEEVKKDGLISVFPNPALNEVFISILNTQQSEIKVYSMEGKLVFSKQIQTNQQQMNLDISNLKAGMYILRLQSKDGQVQNKVLVKQ